VSTASSGYVHGEAFMLMRYVSEDGARFEVIWNSRDGVTPFCVHSRDGVEMRHVDWSRDLRRVDYEPSLGERIFVDLTVEAATAYRTRYVDEFWEHAEYGMKTDGRWASKADAIADLARVDVEQHGGGNPDLVEVTPEILAQLKRARDARRAS